MCMSHVYVHIYTNTYTTHQKKKTLSFSFKFLETESLCEAQNGFEIVSNPSASPTPARGLQVYAMMNS